MYLYLYSLTDPIVNEIKYIGISVNPKRRFRQHLQCTINRNKYEWISFLKSQNLEPKLDILFKSDDIRFILNKEIELIKNLSNLLNISKGGEFNLAYSFGKRVVKMFNLEGELLNTFSSNTEALRFLNLEDSSALISACALRKRNHAHGYIWRYDEDIITLEDFKRLHLSFENSRENKHIFVFNTDGEFINDFESIETCSKALKIGRSGISGVLSNTTNNFSHKGYIFTQSMEDFEIKYLEFLDSLPKSVVQYDLSGKVLNYFKSINSVANFFDTKCNATIKKCCENKLESYNGFIFKYEQVLPSKFKNTLIHFSILDNDLNVIYNGTTENSLRNRLQSLLKDYPEFKNFSVKEVGKEMLEIKTIIDDYVIKPNTQIRIKCLETNTIYESCRQAAVDLNIKPESIHNYLKGKQKGKVKKLYSFEVCPLIE